MIQCCEKCGNCVEGQMIRSFGRKMTAASIKKGSMTATGALAGSIIPGIGTAIGAGIGLVAGVLMDNQIKKVSDAVEDELFDSSLTNYQFKCPKCGHSWITSEAFEKELKEFEEENSTDFYSDDTDDIDDSDDEFNDAIAADNTSNNFFYMKVADVFEIQGRGIVLTGTIETGYIYSDSIIYLKQPNRIIPIKVIGIEMFRKFLDSAEYGDNVGLLIEGVDKEEVYSGDEVMSFDQLSEKERNWITYDKTTSSNYTNSDIVNNVAISNEEKQYLEEYKKYLEKDNGIISETSRNLLVRYAKRHDITPQRTALLEASLIQISLSEEEQEYVDLIKELTADGHLTDKDRRILCRYSEKLNITKQRILELNRIYIKHN